MSRLLEFVAEKCLNRFNMIWLAAGIVVTERSIVAAYASRILTA